MAKKRVESIEERKQRIQHYLGGDDPVVRYVEGNKMGLKRLWSEVVVVPASYDWIDVPAQHCVIVRKKEKYGFVTRDGGLVSDCIYDRVKDFSEGRAAVYDQERFCGYIDEDGKEVINLGFIPKDFNKSVGPFTGEIALIEKEGLSGAINLQGQVLVPYEFYSMERQADFLIAKKEFDEGYGLYDLKGNVVLPCEYSYLRIKDDYCFAGKDDKVGLYDLGGKLIAPIEYDALDTNWAGINTDWAWIATHKYRKSIPGYVMSKKDGKYGVISQAGVVVPAKYKDVAEFRWRHNGALVHHVTDAIRVENDDEKFGIWALDGRELVASTLDYEDIIKEEFVSDLLKKWNIEIKQTQDQIIETDIVYYDRDKNRKGIRKVSGEVVTEPRFKPDNIRLGFQVGDRWFLKCTGRNDDGIECDGLLDDSGAEVLPFQYCHFSLEGGVIIAKNLKNKLGVFDVEGAPIIKCAWDYCRTLVPGMICVGKYKKTVAVYTSDGHIVIPEGEYFDLEPSNSLGYAQQPLDGLLEFTSFGYGQCFVDLWNNNTSGQS